MKKVIVTTLVSGLFVMTLVFSTNASTTTFSEKAFANGVCCPEIGSICIFGDLVIRNFYFKPKGPCNDITVEPEPIKR